MLNSPQLCFHVPFDERTAYEVEMRGYWSHSFVKFDDGSCRDVVFYDPVRLAQDLEEETTQGRPFIAEKRLIVLNSVTVEEMQKAVNCLAKEGFFD